MVLKKKFLFRNNLVYLPARFYLIEIEESNVQFLNRPLDAVAVIKLSVSRFGKFYSIWQKIKC